MERTLKTFKFTKTATEVSKYVTSFGIQAETKDEALAAYLKEQGAYCRYTGVRGGENTNILGSCNREIISCNEKIDIEEVA